MSASIIPTMPYRDAAAAIDWLCRAFGFSAGTRSTRTGPAASRTLSSSSATA